jgi:protein SOK2
LYPLFVHDIGALLYHPQNPNQHRGSMSNANTIAALDRTRDRRALAGTTPGAPTPLHSVSGQMVGAAVPSPSQPRPGMERSHTFPTPPASASSVVTMSQGGAPYETAWNANNNMGNGQPLSIDTGISNQRSVPNTPASTPPGKTTQGAAHYPTPQSYDAASRNVYSNNAPQAQYPNQVRFGGPLPSASNYPKSEFFLDFFKEICLTI